MISKRERAMSSDNMGTPSAGVDKRPDRSGVMIR